MKILFRICLVLALLVLHKTAEGQEKLLTGMVVDSISGSALEGAEVRVLGSAISVITDVHGHFRIPWDHRAPISILATHLGFVPVDLLLPPGDVKLGETLLLRMAPAVIELDPFNFVRPPPEVVFQRDDLHVGAYFANDDGLWVLVYAKPQLWHSEGNAGEQVLRGARLYLLDTLFNERFSCPLPSDARGLYHDHNQRAIVEGMTDAWVAEVRSMADGEEGIELGRIDRTTLHEAVLPWTDSIPSYLLGSNISPMYPAFDHIAYDPGTASSRLICSVEDTRLMDLFRSQYKYMSGHDKVVAMDLEQELGVDREVIAGYMTAFYNDPYFDVPYAPLFVVNDTLCVFDHYRERIRRFAPDLTALDEITMTYQKERTWKTRLLQDAVDGRIYAQFARGVHTWLREVNPGTGGLGRVITLTYPFPEEVQVHDGHAYYVYRPYGSLQHRTLYREALR
ncbi:MAG: hypothetical protein ABI432_03975 [Flavobacteriales bacterium]